MIIIKWKENITIASLFEIKEILTVVLIAKFQRLVKVRYFCRSEQSTGRPNMNVHFDCPVD